MSGTELTIEVNDSEWESLQTWTGKEVTGHRINPGSIIEVQLALEPRHLIKIWTASPDQRRRWAIDPEYDSLLALNLGPKASAGRLIRPLRKGTSLAYFEGKVSKVAKANSKSNSEVEYLNALLDCELPLILEVESKRDSDVPVGYSEGVEMIGVCRLSGMISSPNTLFRNPLKARVVSVSTLETQPKTILLTIEPTSEGTSPQNQLHYTRLGSASR